MPSVERLLPLYTVKDLSSLGLFGEKRVYGPWVNFGRLFYSMNTSNKQIKALPLIDDQEEVGLFTWKTPVARTNGFNRSTTVVYDQARLFEHIFKTLRYQLISNYLVDQPFQKEPTGVEEVFPKRKKIKHICFFFFKQLENEFRCPFH